MRPETTPAAVTCKALPLSGALSFTPSAKGGRPRRLVALNLCKLEAMCTGTPRAGVCSPVPTDGTSFLCCHGDSPSVAFDQIPWIEVKYLNGMEKHSGSSRMAWFLLFTEAGRSWRPRRWTDRSREVLET